MASTDTTTITTKKPEEHWDAVKYQNAAGFVPKLAQKVLEWLDVGVDDRILDIGCGDGIINIKIAQTLAQGGSGQIHGLDSSSAMVKQAKESAEQAGVSKICTFEVVDATKILTKPELVNGSFDKVFSNAAMHWILACPAAARGDFFKSVHAALKPNGIFCFEMGGLGNVAEFHATFLAIVSSRIGIEAARAADPWFFPDEQWMSAALKSPSSPFEILKIEREYRSTPADKSGIHGWVTLMGKQFFDAVEEVKGKKEREKCETESCEILKTVVAGKLDNQGDFLGYVRLRAMVRKI